MQGHALSRLHHAKGPDAHNDAQTDPITSDDLLAAAKAVEMTDLEAGKQEADRQGEDQQDLKKRDSSQTDGGKHVHMADALTFGASPHGGSHSKEAEKKKKLWDDMLKRKVGADMEKQKRDGMASSMQDEEDRMARVDSQAALLDPTVNSSDRVPETLPPSHLPLQHLSLLNQPRFLSKQGLMEALNSRRRLLPALLKKTDRDQSKAGASDGGGAQGGGRLANGMETAGSMDSNAPLLPAGMPSGQ